MDLRYKNIDNKYQNIREVLKNEFKISSRLFLKLRNANQIYVNGNSHFINSPLKQNDIIEVSLNFNEDSNTIVSSEMELDIIYEDDYMLIINKPANIAIHPSQMHFETSLSNGVKYYFEACNLHRIIRIVNRLDKDTSGIVIFAKNEYVQEHLSLQMKNHSFKKEYIRNTRTEYWKKNQVQ